MRWMIVLFCYMFCIYCDHQDFIKSYLKKIPYTTSYASGLDCIDCIYVINLEKHPKRWERMEQQLSNFGLYAQRMEAVDGWGFNKLALKNLYHKLFQPSYDKFYRTPGQIGCFLSHMSILEDAFHKNYSTIWILEDDCEISQNLRRDFSKIFEELYEKNISWDALFTDTGSRYRHADGTLERYEFDTMCQKFIKSCSLLKKNQQESLIHTTWIQRRLGMYSVILSRSGIKKIREYFMTHRLRAAYDVDIHFIPGKRFLQTQEDVVSTQGGFGSSTAKNR